MKTRGVVVSVGARTAIGLTAVDTGLAHRAAAAAMSAAPLADGDGEPATMCYLPTIDPFVVGAERAVALGRPALEEALAPVVERLPYMSVELVLCLDELMAQRGEDGTIPGSRIATELSRVVSRVAPKLADVQTVARGPASLGFVLDKVLAKLESGGADAVVLGGVHTDYDPARIAALVSKGRLFSPDNLDALIPGEAAAFLVLMRADTARSHGLLPRLRLHEAATGQAKATVDNEESAFKAAALTAVARQAGRGLVDDGLRAGWMLTDLSFEMMRLYEFQAMCSRTQRLWCEPQYCDSPAQRLGYAGAATMPLHLVLAAEAWRRGWAPHDVAMSFAGSDGGERAAVLLSSP
ncbi:MAG: hypothetical protein R3B72_47070 [Polyangiaceae bacterium]